MAHLILASTKIPPELSDRLKKFTESTGLNQSATIRRAIDQFLDSAESTGLPELTTVEGGFKPAKLVERVDAVDDRLTDIEARLGALEAKAEQERTAMPSPPIAAPILSHTCPSCGSPNIEKRGWGKLRADGSKAQRLQCRDCRRAFSAG